MKLSEKLLSQFRKELFKFSRGWFKEIYQVKVLTDGIGGSIVFSCRFKTPDYKTYILSITIILDGENPHVRTSIHELCERRWFSKIIASKREPIDENKRLSVMARDSKVKAYFQSHKHFPYNLMAGAFVDNGMKEFIISNVDRLEGL